MPTDTRNTILVNTTVFNTVGCARAAGHTVTRVHTSVEGLMAYLDGKRMRVTAINRFLREHYRFEHQFTHLEL